MTMAQAGVIADINTVDAFELDRHHPRLEVPDEELLDSRHEQISNESDNVSQHGVRIPKATSETIPEVGRTKYTNKPRHS